MGILLHGRPLCSLLDSLHTSQPHPNSFVLRSRNIQQTTNHKPHIMSLKNDAFPSSAAFDTINDTLKSSDAERKDAIKQVNAVFAFTLKNKAGETESWHIDLKNKGEVGKGLGEKPTVTLSLSEEEFGKLVSGKANAQRLFMSGKLKVKGDVMKATKMEPILKKAQTKAKL